MRPLISFVMPNYNKALYLPEALESLVNQTFKNIEMVVIDDGSDDDSRDIIDTYAKRDKRIVRKYLKRTTNLPVAEHIDRARNIGNKIASADIVCVADSDDINLPERAKITYESLSKEKECDLFYGSYIQRNRFGAKEEGVSGLVPATEFSEELLRKKGIFFIGHLTVGYRKKTILKYPYDSYSGVGDWGMFYNLLIKAKIKSCFTIQPLCVYRMYGNSLRQLHDKKFHKYLLDKKRKKMKLLNEA